MIVSLSSFHSHSHHQFDQVPLNRTKRRVQKCPIRSLRPLPSSPPSPRDQIKAVSFFPTLPLLLFIPISTLFPLGLVISSLSIFFSSSALTITSRRRWMRECARVCGGRVNSSANEISFGTRSVSRGSFYLWNDNVPCDSLFACVRWPSDPIPSHSRGSFHIVPVPVSPSHSLKGGPRD